MSEFLPYQWMRAIGRSNLPKRCRDVLRCLAVEMRPGEPEVQIGQRELLVLMGMTDGKSLRNALQECQNLEWLTVDKSRRPNVYRAADGWETNTAACGKPTQRMSGKPTHQKSDGWETNATLCGKPTRSTGGKPTQPPIIENLESLESAAPRAKENSSKDSEDIKGEALEIYSLFQIIKRPISKIEAQELTDDVGKYHPSAVGYVSHRLLDDHIHRRFRKTAALLTALKTDAVNDGRLQRRPEPPAPEPQRQPQPPAPTEPDDYEHPDVWAQALAELKRQIAPDNLKSYLAPLRAEVTDTGLVLVADDEFVRVWVEDHYLDLIHGALNCDLAALTTRTKWRKNEHTNLWSK